MKTCPRGIFNRQKEKNVYMTACPREIGKLNKNNEVSTRQRVHEEN